MKPKRVVPSESDAKQTSEEGTALDGTDEMSLMCTETSETGTAPSSAWQGAARFQRADWGRAKAHSKRRERNKVGKQTQTDMHRHL